MKAIRTAAAISLLMIASQASGQEAETSDGDSDVDTPTLLAYLGLTAADGKNTVGEGAGGIEGHMLASVMAVEAADMVIDNVKLKANRAVLLTGSEPFSLAEYYQADRQLDLLKSETKRFLVQPAVDRCLNPPAKGEGYKAKGEALIEKAPKFDFQPSDALGAFRTSSSFSAVSVTLGAQLFKNAVLSSEKKDVAWVIPSDISQPTGGDAQFDKFTTIRNALIPFADGKCDKTDEAIKKAASTLLARADGLAASKEGAPSLLDKAAVAGTILADPTPIKVLRVEVDKAGGTLVNTSNIFTSLGVPGMTMRGGMVVTYRLVDPIRGTTEAAGIIICQVPQRLLMTITSKGVARDAVECMPAGSESQKVKRRGDRRAR